MVNSQNVDDGCAESFMDRSITAKPTRLTPRRWYPALLVIPLVVGINYLWRLSHAEFSVDGDRLVISEVKRGRYVASVRGVGELMADHVQWLSSNVDAKVEKLVHKAGSVVSKGDLIVLMSNPRLEQQLAEAQWELEAMNSELKADRVAQEADVLRQETRVLDARMAYDNQMMEYKARGELVNTGVISRLEYRRMHLEKERSRQRWRLGTALLKKMRENLAAQNSARDARLKKARNRVARFQHKVNDLRVKATMDAMVLEVPLQVGRTVAAGANIAKLAQQNSMIAQLKIPEIQIRDVKVGQPVTVDTRNSKISGRVSRVDPAVSGGHVRVDVVFTSALPDDARPDLSVDGIIQVAEIEDTLFVDRPLFAQSNSDASIYKVSDDRRIAERVRVKVGLGSVNQIQILEGLQVGDMIVTSDPSRFETYEKFRIN